MFSYGNENDSEFKAPIYFVLTMYVNDFGLLNGESKAKLFDVNGVSVGLAFRRSVDYIKISPELFDPLISNYSFLLCIR
jgi:hypothetical protein